MSNLLTFQQEVGEWANKTFPGSNLRTKLTHLHRELIELKEARRDTQVAEECADMFLILLHICHSLNIDLGEEAECKLEVCKGRIWGKPDTEGVIEHVREDVKP